ncbi:[LSU ribosomal protein L11P]-lysine N-methyltransferase [Flavobacteriaceae bacterium MAR_2010_188]|nr:[LSU ribosomal protein L11P]-lysine N-methyltransferase [Flavobacteriaceae bacterium MAR_2010_188]
MANTNYIEVNFTVSPVQPATDILIAQLGEIGFESFEETEKGVKAYIQKDDWDESCLNEIDVLGWEQYDFDYTVYEIDQVNWNEEWEKNFEPIIVDEKCSIRAPFHEKPDVQYDIIIEPKMSFGTGHHETTEMMVKHLLKLDLENKTVLDMGCGTAVLAILAEMRGAKEVEAIDIDKWCYENSLENIERNSCKNIEVFEGDADLLEGRKYDVIIANINRNILLQDISIYSNCLNPEGVLLLSGFYTEDIESIEKECNDYMLKLSETLEKNNWISLKFLN